MDPGAMERRCPKLGHQLTFAYCQREAGDAPCQRVVLCWEDRFAVRDWLRATLPENLWEDYFDPRPPNKASSLIGLIQKAQKNLEPEGH
jgi:hypothetical protein